MLITLRGHAINNTASYSFLFTYLFLGINIKIMWRGHILNKLANKGNFLFYYLIILLFFL